jgi:HEAT repeat protein
MREVLEDDDYWSRRFALRDAFKQRAIGPLVDGLADPDHRIIAANYLGRLRAADARLPLERLLRASDRAVRSAGVRALGQLDVQEGLGAILTAALQDPASNVRETAVVALGKSTHAEAVPALLTVIESGDPSLAALARRSIRKLRTPAVLPELSRQSSQLTLVKRVPYWYAVAATKWGPRQHRE